MRAKSTGTPLATHARLAFAGLCLAGSAAILGTGPAIVNENELAEQALAKAQRQQPLAAGNVVSYEGGRQAEVMRTYQQWGWPNDRTCARVIITSLDKPPLRRHLCFD